MPQQALIDLIAQNLTQKSSSDRITGIELREVMYNLVNDLYGEFLTSNQINTIVSGLESEISNKVDKVTGKGLSANDFTDILKSKLDGIEAGAEANVNADWNAASGDAQILNKPSSFTPSSHASTHTNGTDDIQLATASQKGLMSTTYASKLDGIAAGANVGVVPNASINGATKTKITYDSKGLVTSGSDATTDDIQEGVTPTNKWWTNSRTISSVLTAFSSGAGTVSASDTILQAIQKIVGNIGSLVTGVSSVNTKTGAVSITTADVPDSIGKRYQTETQNTYNDATSSIQTQLLGKLPIPTLTKTVPIDTDSLIVKDSEDGNKYKDVLKSNINEVYVGDSAPSHNEKVWIDNTADLLVYKSSTTATITPNNTLKVDKYNSNYSAGNTVAVSSPTFDTGKHIDYDDDRVVVIKNTKAGTVTFVIDTLSKIVGGVTYNYIPKNGDTFDLTQNNYGEISYLYTMTSATTCDVLIRFAK